VTDGQLQEGVDPEQYVRAFVQRFKVPEAQARKLLAAGRPVTLKDNLDKATAEKFQRVLEEQIGLQVRLEVKASSLSLVPDESGSAASHAAEPATAPTPTPSGPRCPKCGSDRVQGDDCLACGIIISRYRARQEQAAQSIYAAPAATVVADEMEAGDDAFGLRKVAVDNGWHWIVGGWRHFVGNPFAWIAALILWYVIILVAEFIPFIGSLAVNILSPVFIAGFMLGASEQDSGGDFTIQHLFAGFSANLGNLVVTGLLYLLAGVIVGVVAVLFFVLLGWGSFLQQAELGSMGAGPSVVSIMLLVTVIFTIVAVMSMAFWFVPLLVVFDGMSPIQAIPMSFSACWKNALVFLVYGLVAFGLILLAILPVGLGLLIFAPVMMASIYVSYRDIFHGAAPAV
jgi:uncharacterized membrane protein